MVWQRRPFSQRNSDRRSQRSANEATGHFSAVIFLPQMTRIIEGAPEERRRYLNLALAQVVPGYPQALSDYNQHSRSGMPCLNCWRNAEAIPDSLFIGIRFWRSAGLPASRTHRCNPGA